MTKYAYLFEGLTAKGKTAGLRDQADLKLKGRPEILTASRAFMHLFKPM